MSDSIFYKSMVREITFFCSFVVVVVVFGGGFCFLFCFVVLFFWGFFICLFVYCLFLLRDDTYVFLTIKEIESFLSL